VQSTAAIYAPESFSPAKETDPIYLDAPGGFSQVVQAVSAMEDAVLNTPGITGTVLRYGHIYGPGSPYDRGGFVREDVLRRRMPLFGSAGAYFSFVHLEDVVQATILAVESSPVGIFNIADSHPAQMGEWLAWWAILIGAPKPLRIPVWLARLIAGSYGIFLMESQSGVDNSLARQALSWDLRYPHWRDGFQAFESSLRK
jgi:nucleoside-diphosphate-sugar epimerase